MRKVYEVHEITFKDDDTGDEIKFERHPYWKHWNIWIKSVEQHEGINNWTFFMNYDIYENAVMHIPYDIIETCHDQMVCAGYIPASLMQPCKADKLLSVIRTLIVPKH